MKKAAAKYQESFPLEISPQSLQNIDALLRRNPLKPWETSNNLLTAFNPHNDQANVPFNFDGRSRSKPSLPLLRKHNHEFRDIRESLPIYVYRQEILDVIAANQVVVISGETGKISSNNIFYSECDVPILIRQALEKRLRCRNIF